LVHYNFYAFVSVIKQIGVLVAMKSETRYNANRVRGVVTLQNRFINKTRFC